jgi:hypothetical protein
MQGGKGHDRLRQAVTVKLGGGEKSNWGRRQPVHKTNGCACGCFAVVACFDVRLKKPLQMVHSPKTRERIISEEASIIFCPG